MANSCISQKVKELIQIAKKLETVGKYEEAVAVLSPYWTNMMQRPNVSKLNKEEQAEILLRCGSLAGFIGNCRQLKNSQDTALKFITEAFELFTALGKIEKISECETYMASTFQRLGRLDDANNWINRAFQHKIADNCEVRLHSYVIESLILMSEKNYAKLVERCKNVEMFFRSSSNLFFQGVFNTNYGIGLSRLGELDKAFERFTIAEFFYNKSEHHYYLAQVENNIAILHQKAERYDLAHQFAIKSIERLRKFGDKNREGNSLDTRSQIFMSEGKYAEALACANEAVKLLQKGENYLYLENSLQTKSHIQLYLKDYSGLMETTIEAIRIVNLFSDKPDKRISTVKKIISSNFQKCWTIDELAETINLSKSRFKELFKQKTQLSPIQFVRHLRFEKAKELLKTTHLTVKETGFAVGINDQSGFVRDFKKKYGLTPTEYRNKF
jgi:AraC-like DNA-binding protein